MLLMKDCKDLDLSMTKIIVNNFFLLILIIFPAISIFAQEKSIDSFDSKNGWKIFTSDQVDIAISEIEGIKGNALRIDYNFTTGSGYGGIQCDIELEYPENYEFSYYIKGYGSENNLEFKILDKSGENVWWYNNRKFTFPDDWQKQKIRKKNIIFAWGPSEEKSLKKSARLEFTISSVTGGKGFFILDDLTFSELPPEKTGPFILTAVRSEPEFSMDELQKLTDNNLGTSFEMSSSKSLRIFFDLNEIRDFSGLTINWGKGSRSGGFRILTSAQESNFESIFFSKGVSPQINYAVFPEVEARFIMIEFEDPLGLSIGEIRLLNQNDTKTLNDLYQKISEDNKRGYYPKYFNKEASYWTITGNENSDDEYLINEEGMIEIGKHGFSIEPFIFDDDGLVSWNDFDSEQFLAKSYLPVPGVHLSNTKMSIKIETFTNEKNELNFSYTISNKNFQKFKGKLFIAVRPFLVNPYYQFLNNAGGVSGVEQINIDNIKIAVDDAEIYWSSGVNPEGGAVNFDRGDIVDYLKNGIVPNYQSIKDPKKLASGALGFNLKLNPGSDSVFTFIVKSRDRHKLIYEDFESARYQDARERTIATWENRLNTVQISGSGYVEDIFNRIRSNIAYVLINKDGLGIQPGSRSYQRSWIRDGALTSSALLRFGFYEEVKKFAEWYGNNLFENGKVPCVVDKRGPDPVPENDSHGEYLFLLLQYYHFTGDKVFLRENFEKVKSVVRYINFLLAQRRTDTFKSGSDSLRAFYGIMPESISHEGYSAKPMHSNWDNFWTLRGLKDASAIAGIIGETIKEKEYFDYSVEFRKNFLNSINQTVAINKIDYVPGCVELADFDPTSTTVALYPVEEWKNIPGDLISKTFKRYRAFFNARKSGDIEWVNYTPYEIRNIGAMVLLGEYEFANEMINYFLKDSRPEGWNHWAEVVWRDSLFPGFIGDMPHTWVGSDFINSFRLMIVHENEQDSSISIASGLTQRWMHPKYGFSARNLKTYYGDLNYSIQITKKGYNLIIERMSKMPPGGIKIESGFLVGDCLKPIGRGYHAEANGSALIVNEIPCIIEFVSEIDSN